MTVVVSNTWHYFIISLLCQIQAQSADIHLGGREQQQLQHPVRWRHPREASGPLEASPVKQDRVQSNFEYPEGFSDLAEEDAVTAERLGGEEEEGEDFAESLEEKEAGEEGVSEKRDSPEVLSSTLTLQQQESKIPKAKAELEMHFFHEIAIWKSYFSKLSFVSYQEKKSSHFKFFATYETEKKKKRKKRNHKKKKRRKKTKHDNNTDTSMGSTSESNVETDLQTTPDPGQVEHQSSNDTEHSPTLEAPHTKGSKKKKKKKKRRGNKSKHKPAENYNRTPTASKLERDFDLDMGRPREMASLGTPDDFPTEFQEAMDDFDLDISIVKIKEEVKSFEFRGGEENRPLAAKLRRWKHSEQLDPSEPAGCCGFPICVIVDMKPKRFVSLCNFTAWMKHEGLNRRVFEIQKGGCEDAIEKIGHKRPWISSASPGGCVGCDKHDGCSTAICLNDNGHAKSFDTVFEAMKYLAGNSSLIIVAIGLGKCKALYGSCIYTEWFDFDEPCKKGDVESVYATNIYASTLGNQGRHRSCAARNIEFPAEIHTLEGQDTVPGLIFQKDKDKVVCYNAKNKNRTEPPYHWESKEVTCRDFKIRYCCHQLWGEAGVSSKIAIDEVVVDAPFQKTLFDGCNWLNFMSHSNGLGVGDVESREKNFPLMKKSTCALATFSAMFIDARRVMDDRPWDETGEVITKITPTYGLYCDNSNNRFYDKRCSNYKVRFCCQKEEESQWGTWSDWTDCSKSCGGGNRTRNRVCVQKEGRKAGCFNDGPTGEKRFREMTEDCNRLPCAQDLQWQPWLKWSTCSSTCGKGTRKRHRACFPPKDGGKDCPQAGDPEYAQLGDCHMTPCSDPEWSAWSIWSDCSVKCGVGTKSRKRTCVDIANEKTPVDNVNQECPGPPSHDDDCDTGYCAVNGKLTEWQNWGECTVACGDIGTRLRRRYCANPFPQHGGKNCTDPEVEEGKCVELPHCPQHCLFSTWGDWSACTVTCGKGPEAGTRSRKRHVALEAAFGGLKCEGSMEEADSCVFCGGSTGGNKTSGNTRKKRANDNSSENKASNNSGDSKTSDSSSVSQISNKASEIKTSSIVSESKASYNRSESKTSNNNSDNKASNNSSDDNASDNSSENQRSGNSSNIQACIRPCPSPCVLSEWSEWSGHCQRCYHLASKDKIGLVFKLRSRFVEQDAENGGPPCLNSAKAVTLADGMIEEKRPCQPDVDVVPCPEEDAAPFWTAWQPWGACQAKCGEKEKSVRKRTCINGAARSCHGKDSEEQDCSSVCPASGWTEWDDWTPCQVTCGKGQSARKRTCRDDTLLDQKTCKGIQRETRVCDSGTCGQAEKIKTVGKDATGLAGGECEAKCNIKEKEKNDTIQRGSSKKKKKKKNGRKREKSGNRKRKDHAAGELSPNGTEFSSRDQKRQGGFGESSSSTTTIITENPGVGSTAQAASTDTTDTKASEDQQVTAANVAQKDEMVMDDSSMSNEFDGSFSDDFQSRSIGTGERTN